jgi:hypothetical protein
MLIKFRSFTLSCKKNTIFSQCKAHNSAMVWDKELKFGVGVRRSERNNIQKKLSESVRQNKSYWQNTAKILIVPKSCNSLIYTGWAINNSTRRNLNISASCRPNELRFLPVIESYLKFFFHKINVKKYRFELPDFTWIQKFNLQ